jgi:hypothetical protein
LGVSKDAAALATGDAMDGQAALLGPALDSALVAAEVGRDFLPGIEFSRAGHWDAAFCRLLPIDHRGYHLVTRAINREAKLMAGGVA